MSQKIFDAWQTYERFAVPPGAGPTQREECRRAFYAGALVLFGLAMTWASEPQDTDECVRRIESLAAELHQFPRDLREIVRDN